LPDGGTLKTLAEAIGRMAKEIRNQSTKWRRCRTPHILVTRAAEHGGPMIFAQMGMLQAIQFSDGFSWAKKRPGAR